MRGILTPICCFASWAGVLQALPSSSTIEGPARLIGVASVLGTLTVLVYRLGVWRQEMENTRQNVGAEVKAHRDECSTSFACIERRLDTVERAMSRTTARRTRTVRWQSRTSRRLDQLEQARTVPVS